MVTLSTDILRSLFRQVLEVTSGINPQRKLSLLYVEPPIAFDAALFEKLQASSNGVDAEPKLALKHLLVEEIHDNIQVGL